MLDWRVDTFLDVCETLNYTHTASRLNITQPAVSQHIAWLEKHVSAPLFERKGRNLFLTEAGEMVRGVLQAQRSDEQLLKRELMAMGSQDRTLSLGSTLTAGEYLLARPLARWMNEHPSVRVKVDVADTSDLLVKLDAGEIDCALVEGIFDSTKYSFCEWSHERMVCVEARSASCGDDRSGDEERKACASKPDSGASCSKSEDGRIKRFSDILENTLIVREKGSGSRAVLEASLAHRNLVVESFSRCIEVKGVGLSLEMAAEGLGITFAYESSVSARIAAGQLQEIELSEQGLEHSICFVWRHESAFGSKFMQFFEELKSCAC